MSPHSIYGNYNHSHLYSQEVEKLVKWFPGCDFRGYTERDGGQNAAAQAFKEYVSRQQSTNKQTQTPPISVNQKRKERPASWQAEKDIPRQAQRTKYHGSLKVEPRTASGSDFISTPNTGILSHDSSKLDTDEKDTTSEESTSSQDDSSVEDSTSEENDKGLEQDGSQEAANHTKMSSKPRTSEESQSSDDSGDTSSAEDDLHEESTESILPTPRISAASRDRLSLQHTYHGGGTSYYSRINTIAKADLECMRSNLHVQDRLFHGSSSSSNSTSERASEASTDYGFPDDLALLDFSHASLIKTEPNMDSDESPMGEPPMGEPVLCEEQMALVKLILDGHNVFYTGPAGCGKSAVLKSFVRQLKARNRRVRIIAYTGRAALEAGGVTLHNYAGWTPASMAKPIKLLEKESHGKKNWDRFNSTDVLVIDEISMVENNLFERLNRIMKESRMNNEPFGGVQVIVTGDFCQLPPVKPFRRCMECGKEIKEIVRGRKYRCPHCCTLFYDSDKWAFRSVAWQQCGFEHINLKQVHRQKDMRFIRLLEKCRFGRALSEEDKQYLQKHEDLDLSRMKQVKEERLDGEICSAESALAAIKLFPRRDEVTSENETQLALIDNECLEFNCIDKFKWNPKHEALERLRERGTHERTLKALDEHAFDAKLELKKGMPVILLVNLDLKAGLINGSQGYLVGFEDHDTKKFPDLRGAHACRRERMVKRFVKHAYYHRWPIVRFPGAGGRQLTIYPYCMMDQLGDVDERDPKDYYSLLSRTQIPLLAAWAITIHKSQGMTLDRAEVNLSRAFDHPLCYVALSRVREPGGLTVTNWGDLKQGADSQVIEFLQEKGLLDTEALDGTDMKMITV